MSTTYEDIGEQRAWLRGPAAANALANEAKKPFQTKDTETEPF